MKERMNFKEFKTALIKAISSLSDKDILVIDKGDILLIKREDLETALFLDNAWSRYQGGEDIQSMARLMTAPIFEQKEKFDFAKMSWTDAKSRVMPQVKNVEFFLQPMAKKAKIVFKDNLIPSLGVGYVIDDKHGMAYITADMLKDWGVTLDILHSQVMANIKPFKKDIKKVQVEDGLHYYMANTCDSYDAAKILILLEDAADIQASFSGDMMVGIPNRDTLIVFDSKKPYVPFFAVKIMEAHSTFPYPISPFIFKWEKGRFLAGQIMAL